MDDGDFAYTIDIHADAIFFIHALDPNTLILAVDRIQFTRFEAQFTAVQLWHIAIFHFVQQGTAAEVSVIRRQHDLILWGIAFKHEGAGAGWIRLVTFSAYSLILLLAHDEAAGIVGNLGEEEH